jgi:hypothetical protein
MGQRLVEDVVPGAAARGAQGQRNNRPESAETPISADSGREFRPVSSC